MESFCFSVSSRAVDFIPWLVIHFFTGWRIGWPSGIVIDAMIFDRMCTRIHVKGWLVPKSLSYAMQSTA